MRFCGENHEYDQYAYGKRRVLERMAGHKDCRACRNGAVRTVYDTCGTVSAGQFFGR